MIKSQDVSHKFKSAIERNFNESAEYYDEFEKRHHLFENLSRRLCELIAPATPGRALDVGCGTGISTLTIRESIRPNPIVYAIDISESMLVHARQRCKGKEGIYFIQGDAENLSAYFKEKFDAVFYTASIFLIPKFADSIAQAGNLLLPGGILAFSFYTGLFDESGRDAVETAHPGFRYRYGAMDFNDLRKYLYERRSFRNTEVDYRFEIDRKFLNDFFAIPAQSAGLYPKETREGRHAKVRVFCDRLAEKVSPLFMGWKFVISRKRRAGSDRDVNLT